MADISIWNRALIAAIFTALLITVTTPHEISGCYGDMVTIGCGATEKINILGDFYGLSPPDSESRVCAYSEHDICVVPSQSQSSGVKQMCNGRTNCMFTVSEKRMCINGVHETTYQQIKYECIKESDVHSMCGDASWTSAHGYLTSPNYPVFYPPKVTCTCLLETENDSFILLKTAEFRLKYSVPCQDYLLVEPESIPEEILCGSVHRIFEARKFTLHFHSATTSFKGFLLSYEAVSGVSIRCSPSIHPTPHTLEADATASQTAAPSEPKPEPLNIATTISAPPTYENRTDIIYPEIPAQGDLEATPAIRTPSLKPFEEQEEIEPSIKPPTTSPIHTVSGCFGDIVHFQCKDGELIRILKDLYGSAPDGRCSYQEEDCAVEVVGQRSIVSQICSSKTRCMNFIVTRTFCGERVTSYQQITYSCVPATAMLNMCSRTVLRTQKGYLASPNFPGMYPRNQSCFCTLRTGGGPVQLSVAHFALHDLSKSCGDWLEISTGNDAPPRRLCGSHHGDYSAESITLRFHSDERYSHSGIWLHFQGENDTEVTMACNVPIESVWSTTSTSATTTLTTLHTTPTPTESMTTTTIAGVGMINERTTIQTEPIKAVSPIYSDDVAFIDNQGHFQSDQSQEEKDGHASLAEGNDGHPLKAGERPEEKRTRFLGSFTAEGGAHEDGDVLAPPGGSQHRNSEGGTSDDRLGASPVAPPPTTTKTLANETVSSSSALGGVKAYVVLGLVLTGTWFHME